MINVDTGYTLVGQYEATDLTERPGNPAYSGHISLSRQDEIVQFLHGQADRVTFKGRIFASTIIEDCKEEIDTLKGWLKADDRTKRPPIIVFMAGSGDIYIESVLESLGDITYDTLSLFGNMKGATFTVTLRQYVPFEIAGEFLHETRYARAKSGEYYEMLAYHEYGEALKGVLVRRRHHSSYVAPGDIVKLPSAPALGKATIQPASGVFEDGFGNRDTPTKRLRNEYLALRGGAFVSHLIKE
jgi:hypothetical protein